MIQSGRTGEGVGLLEQAVKAGPREPKYHLSYARGLLAAGQPADAEAALEQGRKLGLADRRFEAMQREIEVRAGAGLDQDPRKQTARHHRAGRLAEAAALYRQIVKAAPHDLEAYDGLAAALGGMGDLNSAMAAYREALAANPGKAVLADNLGNMLLAQGRIEECIAAYRQAVAIDPGFAEAHYHLGSVLSENGHVREGFAHYMHRAQLVYGTGKRPAADEPDPAHKIKHDLAQRDYLAGGKAAADAPYVPDMFQLADGSRVEGPAVNPANATPELLERWRASFPQHVVIDNFLMPEALENLRAYCAGSTVWRKNYSAGYLGAAPEDGFACPLLAQIVEEVQTLYRPILEDEPFRYLGAFKYDSDLCGGTNTHADLSTKNVNFYIAPDEANLDPESGGMEVWDIAAANLDELRRYNSDEAAIREHLRKCGARRTVIPHRANRGTIFRSNQFHKTDTFKFRSDYLLRRINISMLFGQFE